MGDKARGLYGKFKVKRTDGKSRVGMKHDGCQYFVLDIDHDKYAAAAIEAYADSCEDDGYVALARDLRKHFVIQHRCRTDAEAYRAGFENALGACRAGLSNIRRSGGACDE